MRDWVASLENAADKKLVKWKKDPKIENGESIHLRWQFLQSHIIIYVFWEDNKEGIHFQFIGPRACPRYEWHGLTDNTFNKVMDRVGNLAQITMYPPIDPELDT